MTLGLSSICGFSKHLEECGGRGEGGVGGVQGDMNCELVRNFQDISPTIVIRK